MVSSWYTLADVALLISGYMRYCLFLRVNITSACSPVLWFWQWHQGVLLLGRKLLTNLDRILKSGDITLPTKVHLVKAMIFSSSHIWMRELNHKEGWAWKNWLFWIVVLEKTLESLWTARRWNQSILKEISPEYSLEGLLLKLKL